MSVRIKDIDINNLTLSYYSPKIEKHSIVSVSEEFVEKLLPLINDKAPDDKLIEYADLHNLGRAYREFLSSIGLDKRGYTLRTFRKTFISKAYESGVDYTTLSKLVGHSNIKTTAKYYTKFSLTKQQEELSKMSFLRTGEAEIFKLDVYQAV